MPNIYEIAAGFSASLAKQDDAALRQMVAAYSRAIGFVDGALADLHAKMQEARANGVTITPAWCAQETRFVAILAQLKAGLDTFAVDGAHIVHAGQAAAARRGIHDAAALIDARLSNLPPIAGGHGDGIRATLGAKVNMGAAKNLAGFLADGSPVVAKLRTYAGPDAVQKARDAMVSALLVGQPVQTTAREVKDALSDPLWQSLRLVRTETMRAYRQTSQETYNDNADVTNGWEWSAHLGPNSCGMCVAMHGTKHPLSETFGSHANCRCAPIPITKTWAEMGIQGVDDETSAEEDKEPTGVEWFEQQTEDAQKRILGPGKYAAYKAGDLILPDLVGYKDSPDYGPTRFERSLKDILDAKGGAAASPPAPSAPVPVAAPAAAVFRPITPDVRRVYDAAARAGLTDADAATMGATLRAARVRAAAAVSLAPAPGPTIPTVPAPVSLVPLPHELLKSLGMATVEPTWNDPKTGHLKQAWGGVLVDDNGRFLLRKPTGNFDGYHWTFAKGGMKVGDHPVDTAVREVGEETGHTGQVVGFVPGVYQGGTSANRYFLMTSTAHDAALMDKETEATRWATPAEARALIAQTTNVKGRARDLAILDAAVDLHANLTTGGKDYAHLLALPIPKPPIVPLTPAPGPTIPTPPAATPAKKPRAPRKPKAAASPLAGTPAPAVHLLPAPLPPGTFPASLDTIERVKALGGSTGAELVKDTATGRLYVRKKGASADHLREEVYADAAYRALGVAVPDSHLYDTAAGPVKLAEFIAGTPIANHLHDAAVLADAQKGFAADALLGNWDVAGLNHDNMLVDGKGTVWRVDNGGSLRFRAMGGKKVGDDWNAYPDEWWTLRNAAKNRPAAAIFGSLGQFAAVDQVPLLAARRAELLAALPADLHATVSARMDALADVASVTGKMKADNWVESYADRFTRHIVGLNQAGYTDGLPKLLASKTSLPYELKDENGEEFDNLRGGATSLIGLVSNYLTSIGSSWTPIENTYAAQAGSSWSDGAKVLKSWIAAQRGAPDKAYYWRGGKKSSDDKLKDAFAKHPTGAEIYADALATMHAATYQMLRNVHIPNADRAAETMTMLRTEQKNVLIDQGFKMGDSGKTLVRGASESFSSFNYYYYLGTERTKQTMPFLRVLGSYIFGRSTKTGKSQGLLAGDHENEFVCSAEGILISYEK